MAPADLEERNRFVRRFIGAMQAHGQPTRPRDVSVTANRWYCEVSAEERWEVCVEVWWDGFATDIAYDALIWLEDAQAVYALAQLMAQRAKEEGWDIQFNFNDAGYDGIEGFLVDARNYMRAQ